MASEPLNVIALISGGKDSFFSVLHCLQNGHRIVALANLYPPSDAAAAGTQVIEPQQSLSVQDTVERDPNSFMYQTVGHEIIPLYAQATGLPLYRQAIVGGAAHHERDYAYDTSSVDETESMVPLLKAIMKRHPEANAICSGAILSTYQRTRVESIALRLGLTPLAYLWKYTALPSPTKPANESQLLLDMAAAGLESRIIKVASAGLDESFLWSVVSSEEGSQNVKRALRKFGAVDGASLGEGGEFETLVVSGPKSLFRMSIAVPEDGRKVVQEGGGSAWLALRDAQLQPLDHKETESSVRIPELLDEKFESILDSLKRPATTVAESEYPAKKRAAVDVDRSDGLLHLPFMADKESAKLSVEEETMYLVGQIQKRLVQESLTPADITSVVIVLRRMADFPKINTQYGSLFDRPNPPSRVTISSGDLLPEGINILIYITVPMSPSQSNRDGLHVQSRSYWAPANIGPYSQAVGISVDSSRSKLKTTYIAGQIPLVPSTMLLPALSPTSQSMQITLSLQHLWRIGRDRGIQAWTSAVAYFAKSPSQQEMKQNAILAGRAWQLIHKPTADDDEDIDASGPDLWDLKYNPEYMTLANAEQTASSKSLPDLEIFSLNQQNEPASCEPPFFAVEVQELPRQSAVEWHAHIGLSGVEESAAEFTSSRSVGNDLWHQIVRDGDLIFVHSVVAVHGTGQGSVIEQARAAYQTSVEALELQASKIDCTPYLVYSDTSKTRAVCSPELAIIPCHSIWSAAGQQEAAVALFKQTFTKK